jgi:cytochrome P450
VRERVNDALVNLFAHPIGWPLARVSRRMGGTVRIPGFGTIVNDAELAHQILVDDATFIKNAEGSLSETMTELLGPFALGNMDGEPHRQLREKLRDALSPAASRRLLDDHDAQFVSLRGALDSGSSVDLADWMRVLSGRLTFDMLGVPLEAERADDACREIISLGERIAAGLDFRRPGDTRLASAKANCAMLADYARKGYESAMSPPASLIRRLRESDLSFDEAKGVVSLVFLAGTLTTAAALPRIVALLIDGEMLPSLRRTEQWVPAAIAEGLRYVTPVPATMRTAQRDVHIGRRRFRRGERLIILTCNLARNARLFPMPDSFDPKRVHDSRARNLWYGAGPHFCLGFSLAQQQLQRVLETLTQGDGELRIVSRKFGRRTIVPSYRSLVVRRAS